MLKAICAQADVVIIDSLRAAAPGVDENSSEVRAYLDLLTRLSEATGTTFIVIHHAGKPREGQRDARFLARGSSAIFDAAGCVLTLDAVPSAPNQKRVSMAKTPASAEGTALDHFELLIEDVAHGDSEREGVRVRWCGPSEDAFARDRSRQQAVTLRVVDVIRDNPGCSQSTVVSRCGMKKSRVVEVLEMLVEEGRVTVCTAKYGAKLYSLADHLSGVPATASGCSTNCSAVPPC